MGSLGSITVRGARAVAVVIVTAGLVAGIVPASDTATAATPDDVVMTPELHERIQEKIDQFVSAHRVPGMSVAVVTPGPEHSPVVTHFAAGTPTIGSGVPVTATTQFEIGSETKVFTSDLLAALIAAGTVSLDDTVSQYAPDGVTVPSWIDPETGAMTEITLRDLATHQAALPDSPENYWEPCGQSPDCNPQPMYTQEMLWEGLAATPLLWRPGTNWLYSNFGFGLLGTILANEVQPTGLTEPPAYLPALASTFLDDLAMHSTMLGTGPAIATPYDSENAVSYYWNDTNALAGEGGLVSHADDMAIWVAAHLGHVSPDAPLGVRSMPDTLRPLSTITTMCSDPSSCEPVDDFRMGMAWQLYPAASRGMGADWAFKNGGTAGFSADTTLAPTRGVGVTTMWNQQRPDGDDLEPGIELLALILNFRPEPHDEPAGGGHDDRHPRELAQSGGASAPLLFTTATAAALLLAGALLIGRRRGRRALD